MSTQQISLALRGMGETAPTRAVDLQRSLMHLDGVVAAQVNYASERATIIYDPTRATVRMMVQVLRQLSFDTPLERVFLYSDDLPYATSSQTLERVLLRVEGVVSVTTDMSERTVTVELIPDLPAQIRVQRALARLGLKIGEERSSTAVHVFMMRTGIIAVIAALSLWSAGAHAGWFVSPGSLHTPLVVAVLSLVALLGAGFPFYQFAFDAMLQGELDASVALALTASAFGVGSVPLGILIPSAGLTDLGFLLATVLTFGWFLARALELLWVPRLQDLVADKARTMMAAGSRHRISILSGLAAAAAMLGVYLGILSLLQSPAHAWEQLTSDSFWAVLIALGFGTQIGLYTHLRLILRAVQAAGATAITGAGTGTSTLGMLACCAHHLSDVAPLVALTGAGGLSGAVGFFTEYKYAFVGVGIVMNLVGIFMTALTIRRCQMLPLIGHGPPEETQTAIACH